MKVLSQYISEVQSRTREERYKVAITAASTISGLLLAVWSVHFVYTIRTIQDDVDVQAGVTAIQAAVAAPSLTPQTAPKVVPAAESAVYVPQSPATTTPVIDDYANVPAIYRPDSIGTTQKTTTAQTVTPASSAPVLPVIE
jgi:hypothetical protein